MRTLPSPRLPRLSRPALLALLVGTLSGCGAETNGSTETGNPPLVAANTDRIEVNAGDGEVTVSGGPGAVSPGNARVVVTHVDGGEKVTVTAEEDGSFSAELPGSVEDEYRVEVRANGKTTEVTLEADPRSDAGNEAEPTLAERACAKICAGPSECGANEYLFPVVGCDCDGSVCDCTEEECVSACLTDLENFREQGIGCSATMDQLHECILAAPCEAFAVGDTEAVEAVPECAGVIETFEDNCYFGSADSCYGFSQTGSGGEVSDQTSHCTADTQCAGSLYGLECTLTDPDTTDYLCSCTEDGERFSFSAQSACGFGNPDDDPDVGLRYLGFRCGWELPLSRDTFAFDSCEAPTFEEGAGDNRGACAIAATCDGVDYGIDCSESAEGVSCDCLRDDELVGRTELDSAGCFGAKGLMSGDENEFTDSALLLTLRSICPW